MTFSETLWLVIGLLYCEKRVSYERLRFEFNIKPEVLEHLRRELVVVRRLAEDENDEVLAWIGGTESVNTPSHMAESGVPGTATESAIMVDPGRVSRTHTSLLEVSKANEAARRQLTIMFCDLVGSTAMSTQLDPEDLQDLYPAYQEHCATIIQKYEGYVAKYMGDGILVYFGFPQAHENDAERAVLAALEILHSLPGVNADAGERFGVEVAVRVGIATGPVVVGDIIGEGAAEEVTVVGETPNIAARLQGVAMPNQVVIGPGTHRLIGKRFECADLGTHEVKGISEPLQVWQVINEVEDDSGYGELICSTPLLGRHEELGLLLRSWENVQQGRGQVVLVQGEAGLGKSRLIEALCESASNSPHTWASFRSSPYHTASPFHPVAAQVRRTAQWEEFDSNKVRLEKLERILAAQTNVDHDELVPLFAALLSLPIPLESYPALELLPKDLRVATFDALAGWILERTEQNPMLLMWEDLHWADPSTIELLGLMLDQVSTARLLIVATYRPEFVAPWPARNHVTPITLSRLKRTEVEVIATNLAGGKALPAVVLEHISNKGDGVPLHIEELTRTILAGEFLTEREDHFELRGSLADMQIPETLQESLMARLDRVPTLRELLQIGAVLGREFAYEMMHRLSTHEESVLQNGLAQLVESEFLYQRGRGLRARYVFKHALIQDAAYQSLLRRTRQLYHGRVAEMLEEAFPEIVKNHPELLAHHYAESGKHLEKAVVYWTRAADLALAAGANVEAVSHISAALLNLSGLDETNTRHEQELQLQTKLGPVIVATRGYTDPMIVQCYTRAWALCKTLDETRELVLILRGQQLGAHVSGDVEGARSLAFQIAEAAGRQNDESLRVGAYQSLAQTHLYTGRLQEALHYADEGISLYNAAEHSVENWPGGQPGEQCYLMASFARWLTGHPDTSIALLETALTMLRASTQTFSLANLLALGALVPVWRGDYATVKEWLGESSALCRKHAIEYWLRFAECLLAWTAAKESKSSAGLTSSNARSML